MKQSMTRANWRSDMERHCLNAFPAVTKEAKEAFKQGLSEQQKMMLLEELVETRGRELCLAYNNVIGVSYGMGRKNNTKTNRKSIRRTPCITFLVKRKDKQILDKNPEQVLPKFLCTYATVGRKRRLCAIPTDVEEAANYTRVAPQTARERIVTKPLRPHNGLDVAVGTVTCAAQIRGFPNQLYAMSCRHVFGVTKTHYQTAFLPARAHLVSSRSPRILGRTLPIGGHMIPNRRFSHDAQLANVTDMEALRRALNGVDLRAFARKPSDIPKRYAIMAPAHPSSRNPKPARTIIARWLRYHPNFVIHYPGVGPIVHKLLVESLAITFGGDSGSPVVAKHPAGGLILLGMHIAGDEQKGIAIMIPAWEIFNPKNYRIKRHLSLVRL